MKIAILEFETHTHLLLQWDALLQNSGINYHFYVSPFISQQVAEIPDSRKTILESENYFQLHEILAEKDFVIFNTLHRNFQKFDSLINEKKTLLLVHNANFFFHSQKPDWSLFFKIKNIHLQYYYLKLIFKEKIFTTKNIIKKAEAYAFLNEKITQRYTSKNKVNVTLPLIYNKFDLKPLEQKRIKIVIPGEVSQSRRNYRLIFDIVKKLSPKQEMEFIFLGKLSDSSLLQKLQQLKQTVNDLIQITYFKERIPQSEFDTIMNNSHFVLCPLHKETQFYLQKEVYGKSKASGNEADCITFGKIGIFPEHYQLNGWTTLYYHSSENLRTILENLSIQEYHKLKENLKPKLSSFSKERVKNELITLLTTLSQS